jgi:hypothetical protein
MKMKKIIFLTLVCVLSLSVPSGAVDFLKAPVIQPGKVIMKTDSRLELKTTLSHDQAFTFYKEALKAYENIKFRDWEDSTYIEDDGKLPWHSITISKGDKDGATVIILKDNWTWIIGTLILRYIGVFAVLLVLYIGMSVSGNIISRSIKRMEGKKQTQTAS